MERTESTKETLKKLPVSPRKSELREMYSDYPSKIIKEEINSIIRENRGIPEDQPVYCKYVRKCEFEKLIKMFGYPMGYEKHFR